MVPIVSHSSLSIHIKVPQLFNNNSAFSLKSRKPLKIYNKRKKQEKEQRDKRKHTNQNTLRSQPTPLIIHQTPYKQTRHQAIDAILNDLEASIARGVEIEPQIFSSLLETCFKMQAIDYGRKIHRLIPERLLRKNTGLSSKLLRLYASCGYIDDAHEIFDGMSMVRRNESAFAWNSMISGYTELGQFEDALALYYQMDEDGVAPDQFTFPRVLKACAGLGSIQAGEAVHRDIIRSGFGMDTYVLNALIDMYAKCGDIVKARKVFDKISNSRDLVSWNSMLTGFTRHGLMVEALEVFRGMLSDGFEPDSIAISAIVSAFPESKFGFEVHGLVVRKSLECNLSIVNSLIVVYSQQGKLAGARWLFNFMPERDVISWNSIISAHSDDPCVLTYFQKMEQSNVSPDNVTFISLLSACANLGLVEDGQRLFVKMQKTYEIKPEMEHLACMVNLLGRAGLINEGYEMIVKMGFDAGPTVWGALLHACSLHGNVNVGEIAANKLFELELDNAHNFELLMMIYGKAGKWEDVEKVMRLMEARGLHT